MKNIHLLTMQHVKENLREAADQLCSQADYYANTPEGQAEVQEAASEAGRAAVQAGRFAWAIACGVARSFARKTQDCCQAARQTADGDYRGAGKTIAEMELRRARAMKRTAGAAAGAAIDGALMLRNEDEASRLVRKNRLKRRLKRCAIAGGAVLLGTELLDDDFGDDDGDSDSSEDAMRTSCLSPPCGEPWRPDGIHGDGDVLPESAADELPGVEDGFLADATPENVQRLAREGEIYGADHHIEVERSPLVRQEFLERHGLEEVPPGYEIHHIVPLSEGGADAPENMIILPEDAHKAITRAHRFFYGWPGPEAWED